jgi:Leucine-rich repeat (LRR) protein
MPCLQKLSMSCNHLECLPPALAQVTALQLLDVSFNKLTDLPIQLSVLTELNALNVSFNPLGEDKRGGFPEVLFELRSLKEVNFDYTGCNRVSDAFGNLTNLESIQVHSSF